MRKVYCAVVVLLSLGSCKTAEPAVTASNVDSAAESKGVECIGGEKGKLKVVDGWCQGFYRIRFRTSSSGEQKIALYGASSNMNSAQTWTVTKVSEKGAGSTYMAENAAGGKMTLEIDRKGEVHFDAGKLGATPKVVIECMNEKHRSYVGTGGEATFTAIYKPAGAPALPQTVKNLSLVCAEM